MKKDHIIILITTKDKKEAGKIAQCLLESKLIACANILDGVQSLFWWQGKIDSSKETLLVLKTKNFIQKSFNQGKVLTQLSNPRNHRHSDHQWQRRLS